MWVSNPHDQCGRRACLVIISEPTPRVIRRDDPVDADRCRSGLGDDRCQANDHLGGAGTHLMSRMRGSRRKRQQVRVGAPDAALSANARMAAVTELCGRLGDRGTGCGGRPGQAAGPGFGPGELLTGIAAARLADEDFLVRLGPPPRRCGLAGRSRRTSGCSSIRPRSPLTRRQDAVAPCTQTSAPCRTNK